MTGIATCVGCLLLAPQLWRLVRHRSTAGVSAPAAALGVVQTGSWIVYGTATHAWAVVIPSALAAPQYAVLAFLVSRSDPVRGAASCGQALASALVVAGAAGVSTMVGRGPWLGVGATLTVAVAWQYWPAVVAAFGPDGTRGISPTTWALIGFNGLVWTTYGMLAAATAVWAYGLVLVGAAAAVLVALTRDRARNSSRPPQDARHPGRPRSIL